MREKNATSIEYFKDPRRIVDSSEWNGFSWQKAFKMDDSDRSK